MRQDLYCVFLFCFFTAENVILWTQILVGISIYWVSYVLYTVWDTFIRISFLPLQHQEKRKPPWTSSDLFKATENPNCCFAVRSSFHSLSVSCTVLNASEMCLPLRDQSTGGYWNTKGWEDMVPRFQMSCKMRQQHRSPSPPAQEATWMSPPLRYRVLPSVPHPSEYFSLWFVIAFVVHLP